jgi:RimJ/RimL family protein N-acetyltransferase
MISATPVILDGDRVRLEPISVAHHSDLCAVGFDQQIWKWMSAAIRTAEEMREYIEIGMKLQSVGTAFQFATVDKISGRAVGSTRFGNIDRENRHVEIGWTWIGVKWQRSHVNTEAKLLMLRHAFEVWKCLRVEFKTDVLNEKSRAAILRLGAKQEGIFRKHMLVQNGRMRDTIWFSITDDEWPEVKANLEGRLKNRSNQIS